MFGESDGVVRVGVDIGGTFTDLMLVTENGEVEIAKALTTSADPSRGVEEVLLNTLKRSNRSAAAVRHLVHGTTLVTNAVIERKGAKTALVTSMGFRDSIEIGREHRYELYDLMLEHPKPIVPRHLRFAVPERTLADGRVDVELDDTFTRRLANELAMAGIEAVAICFLHSYVNPESEQRALRALRDASPGFRLSLSSEVVPELGEFERASTTIVNVYVQPLVKQYLTELEARLDTLGFQGQFFVMLSSGGVATVDTCTRFPVRLLESGPAAGALAAAKVGSAIGHDSLLSFDMGGTTAKLSVVEDGAPLIAREFEVDRRYRFKKGSGLPVKIPVVEMIEIGAGGGSIARVDSLGLLKVGPESAGADPGPACYGRGGRLPTATDANLVLGYLDPGYFLGGAMKLDVEAARSAISEEVGDPMGLSVTEAAWGIHQVVNENMANAARVHVIERGKNPRTLPVIAFGGAGPAHGYGMAELLGSPEVVFPYGAGVTSAMGLLAAPLAFDFVRFHFGRLDELDWKEVTELFEDMEKSGSELLVASGADAKEVSHVRTADMRYVGQGHEIRVPIPDGTLSQEHLEGIDADFDRVYQELYGRKGPPIGLEALTWRVVSQGPRPGLEAVAPRVGGGNPKKGERAAYFPACGGFISTPVYDRYKLGPESAIVGPAIIEERESTAIIGPGGCVSVDVQLNILVAVGAEGPKE